MNIKKNSVWMLSLVFGVSVILYILDVPMMPASNTLIPTLQIPTHIISPTVSLNTFSSSVDYPIKGRDESISVTLTLNGSIITEVRSIHSMNDGKSRMYQQNFEAVIQPLVIGKDIKTLNLSRVAGASFTTDAFMQAIEQIKSKI